MTKEEIIAKVKSLNLPQGSYIVFGSAPLAAAGIREAKDIDLLVSEGVLEDLRKKGWKELKKSATDVPLVHDIFEAHKNWLFSTYSPTLAELLSRAVIYEDVPFASIEDVKRWKEASGRPKDLTDLELISSYRQQIA